MRNLWILTRFLLKSGPGKSNQKSGKKKAFSDGGRIVVYLLLGVCLLPVSVLLFLLGYSGYTFLQPLGLETLLIEFVCAIGMMVIFFYGLPLFLSEYYMDSDLVKLLPLPFTPSSPISCPGTGTEKLTPCSTAAAPYCTVRSCTQSPAGGGVVCGIMTHPSPAAGSDKAETARPAAR